MLWPAQADYNMKTNSYVGRDKATNYNFKGGEFPTLTHDYADHKY